ncbi:MAG: CCA tRNA nucleotidyltransferase [Sphingomonadaceae bacterium]|nr:CCA tRNA nucleotidyltransferase [Sphingomonadaceae bacterium]
MSGVQLGDAEWREAEGLKRIVAALRDEHGGPRIVGGAVRDSLLRLPVSDIDLATTLIPEAVVDRLEAARIKAIPTGIDHGTVTAVTDGKNYEITTLRRDVATDGRRATVEFATDWREDASRRDFTINALYADPVTGEIFDYFGGLADLDAGIVRFIGDPDQRIAEDYLRILRYFRFLARYGHGAVDAEAVAACARGVHGLTALSRERIAQELTKLLSSPDPSRPISLMVGNGIFSTFLPEVNAEAALILTAHVKREAEFAQPASLPARLLTLLPKDVDTVDRVAARLKLSNRMREALALRVSAPPPDESNIRALAYRCGVECARDVAMLYADGSHLAGCMKKLTDWDIPLFGIKGGDLIALGLPAGPLVAKTLQAVEAIWIDEDFPPEIRQVAIARASVAEALSAARNA